MEVFFKMPSARAVPLDSAAQGRPPHSPAVIEQLRRVVTVTLMFPQGPNGTGRYPPPGAGTPWQNGAQTHAATLSPPRRSTQRPAEDP
jgi:hypothetical protein